MTLELSLLFVIASVLWIQPRLLAEAESSRNWSSSVTFFSLLSGEINYCLVTGNHFSLLKQITQGSYICASPLSGIYFRGAVVPGFWRRALDRVFPGCLFSWYLPVILFLSACGGGDEPSTSLLPVLLFVLWKTEVALGDRQTGEQKRGSATYFPLRAFATANPAAAAESPTVTWPGCNPQRDHMLLWAEC